MITERICQLLEEAEMLRTRLEIVGGCCNISTAAPSPDYSLLHVPDSPASTIYLNRTNPTFDSGRKISPQLNRILPTISSAVHRRALLAVDQHGYNNVKWKNGFSALHWASKFGRVDIYEYLVSKGADEKACDSEGKTALEYAAIQFVPTNLPNAQQKAVHAMRTVGWKNIKWGGGWTILHWAFQNNRKDLIEFCLSMGMPIDIKDDKGHFPEHYAPNNQVYTTN